MARRRRNPHEGPRAIEVLSDEEFTMLWAQKDPGMMTKTQRRKKRAGYLPWLETRSCRRCGWPGHLQQRCPARDVTPHAEAEEVSRSDALIETHDSSTQTE